MFWIRACVQCSLYTINPRAFRFVQTWADGKCRTMRTFDAGRAEFRNGFIWPIWPRRHKGPGDYVESFVFTAESGRNEHNGSACHVRHEPKGAKFYSVNSLHRVELSPPYRSNPGQIYDYRVLFLLVVLYARTVNYDYARYAYSENNAEKKHPERRPQTEIVCIGNTW